jgi:hypothetical protein
MRVVAEVSSSSKRGHNATRQLDEDQMGSAALCRASSVEVADALNL